MVLSVSFYFAGSHSAQFSSLVLEKECIGFQLKVFHFIILIFVFFFFFPPWVKILLSCSNRERIRTAYLAVKWKDSVPSRHPEVSGSEKKC